ncbi:MAG TPA: globin family protein [Burkholderiales bacterium]|nr:globin family protein [Burkholderiales bacterium]
MTPHQIDLVQASWKQVVPVAETAAQMFYGRLFFLDPSLRHLFLGDMRDQGRKVMAMLSYTVNGLNRLDVLLPAVRALGRRHATYGVRPEHYFTVGAALLWTLEQGLGAAFTPAVREAWVAAYGVLADTMRDAAEMSA